MLFRSEQQINGLTVGNLYELSFEWAAFQLQGSLGATSTSIAIQFGSQSASTPSEWAPPGYTSGWMTNTTTFMALSSSEILSFVANGSPIGINPIGAIDNVRLTAQVSPVPEPGEYATAFAGMLVVAGVARRIRTSKAH